MKYLKIPFLLLSLLIFASCEDVIELDVPEGKTRIVVEGLLTDQDELQTVKITTTKPYFDKKPLPVVSGATVTIVDDSGEIYPLEETSTGTYQRKFAGVIGRTYRLVVDTPAGERYESLEKTLRPVAPIDDIYYEYRKQSAFVEHDGNYVSIVVSDPFGKQDYYRWRYYINGQLKNKPEDLYYGNDLILDGSEGLIVSFGNHALQPNDHALVEQMSISENAYNFLNLLYLQTGDVGSQFDTPPAPVVGNIININKREDYALGYFMVSAVKTAAVIIESSNESETE